MRRKNSEYYYNDLFSFINEIIKSEEEEEEIKKRVETKIIELIRDILYGE